MDYPAIIATYLAATSQWARRSQRTDARAKSILGRLKRRAVSKGDQHAAKLAWCYETILSAQESYLGAFQAMKQGEFYEAWKSLERVEIEIPSLMRHFSLEDASDPFKISFMQAQTILFQSLFPYKFFLSPAMLHLEKVCSICRTPISLHHPCPHRKGEVYDGELCCHEITKADILELSIVTEPVQKYSVLFLKEEGDPEGEVDHYNYTLVNYVISALREPFDKWDVKWTKTRHPHSLYSHVPVGDPCPCGSGTPYRKCCLPTPGVLRPHVQVLLAVPPPEAIPRLVLPNPGR